LNVLPTNSDKGKQDENQFDPTKVSFLHGIIDPSWIDGNPGQPGPIFRTAMADLVVAELLHDISVNLQDGELATKVHNIGKELVSGSSHGLAAGWEDGDDICPPWFKGGLRPHGEELALGPRPEPWLEHVTPAMNDIVLGPCLTRVGFAYVQRKSQQRNQASGRDDCQGS
jgi:hypothetical protein